MENYNTSNIDNVLLLKGDDIINLFKNREQDILDLVKLTYKIHGRGDSTLPHSSFLRFPDKNKERIIALPAYLGGEINTAGIKWIASFPGNLARGMERASAILIINSTETGRPQAIMEGSVISAKRTAASAALAAHFLRDRQSLVTVGLIGCGLINFETVRFLLKVRPEIETLFLYDVSLEKSDQFKRKCQQLSQNRELVILDNPDDVFKHSSVIALATTASQPHIVDISACQSDSIILHTSLRDLSPEIILSVDNIVDDIDHVCRAQTSIHLAEQKTGNRDFIRCPLSDILNGVAAPRQNNSQIAVFSPFGLGVLDLALGQLAYQLADETNVGTRLTSFFPVSWLQREDE
ncbi:Ornithine cyclodeaminase/mu-crystallin family [Coleofasciculus chthonoplastes PCC 7420]|uniref:Ornithine cyclodeaminase/mu-crystallin family n=1 Tax=Coleofasciculus chthonoplastes PCC 7420 TaxID=118168 RepID=B4VZM8_9CYAN|nr:2,3-diaminopropionate biosynthesis protein SbnB [Coleofasciculus chthonoplastes]EDX72615.1 Ornithine cyclodeaminase/mu-crystallin family [Coleofasciculus chthonoplastes PCC 7420]